jgi:ribose 5-phosphate isomerase B
MKIALASDHAGFELKEYVSKFLSEKDYQVLDFGTYSTESVDYPDFAFPASESVVSGVSDFGILICGTGTGMSIIANKVMGIRAASCTSADMAEFARSHNNANILTMGSRLINQETALEIVKRFLETDFDGGRHKIRIDKIHSLTGG